MKDMNNIPGYEKMDGIEFLYIQGEPSSNFNKLTRFVQPPLPKGGGVSEEGCCITTPDGDKFYAVEYHFDILGWRKQIKQGASMLNLLTGIINNDNIELSDGRSYNLSDCIVELY
ncbi:hypothetical protein O1451_23415 [Bacteroides fragilis]|uniref:hypothetical protein n=1 Tax=Bacteroidaceae TaxID=815 RepID=UPI0022AB1ECC|nr:hypothetical protein [Bacteroides fragilis]MCE9143581.1 hypothetical protein [Bacteroides fragilis]MCZ2609482.1 hypothetical protein [Bacteroides fragilis]